MKHPIRIPSGLSEKLWQHQKDAIHFAAAYLRDSSNRRTALLRLPTGTGKTGIIATLSIALPPNGWTLILTPWRHLCGQMIDDLRHDFWKERGWTPPRIPSVNRLYPSNIDVHVTSKQPASVFVATFATLVAILKNKRPKYRELASKLAQIFVDEGHYEPAVEWGQAVKQLQKPTVLLTATPYRNDMKLFRVSRDDVYDFTHKKAQSEGIIRPVDFRALQVAEPNQRTLEEWCRTFANFWKKKDKLRLNSEPRAIICCAQMSTVQRVTTLLRSNHRINALGIHERFGATGKDWLRTKTPEPSKVKFDVWVHQNKLTEGLDDQRFCVLGLLNRIKNDRKLVQQIGRVLRRGTKRVGRALVLYSNNLSVEKTWQNYLKFEAKPELMDPERYRQIFEQLLDVQPSMEYFGGRFRSRFDSSSSSLPQEVRLHATALVRWIRSNFDFQHFTAATSDFLLLEDRVFLGAAREHFNGPKQSRLWVYAVFGNSPLLIDHAQYEIRLGATAAALHGNLLFMVDTESLYPIEYLGEYTSKLTRETLGRVFASNSIPKEVSAINPWPQRYSVRRMAIYSDNLANTPAQLRDSVFSCAGARATTPAARSGSFTRRQYLGFHRGRVSEQIQSALREEFSLNEFVEWTEDCAKLINDTKRKTPEFFSRYLSPVAAPPIVEPRFVVFNMFEGEVDLQDEDGRSVQLVESVVCLAHDTKTHSKGIDRFAFSLRYKSDFDKERSVSGYLNYDPASSRFRFSSEALNSRLIAIEDSSTEATGICTYLNKHDDCFSVALKDGETYYTAESFYEINYGYAETRFDELLTSVPALAVAGDEKGSATAHSTKFDPTSVFGVIADLGESGIIVQNFGKPEFFFCDDFQTEVADFVCVDFSGRKLALIHAKGGAGHVVSASALHDVVAQAQKNLAVLSYGHDRPKHLSRWNRSSKWKRTRIRRWIRGSASLPVEDALWSKIKSEVINHPGGSKEVWVVVGQVLKKTTFLRELADPAKRNAETGQVVYLLSGLQSSCSQLDVNLRVFCH